MPNSLTLFYTEEYKKHDTGPHPEQPKRMDSVYDVLRAELPQDRVQWVTPRSATEEVLQLVHTKSHIQFIEKLANDGGGYADPDTVVSPASFDTAKLAAGGLLDAVDAIASHPKEKCFVLCRPPGHHCLADQAMGFCLFNNISIAARYAQSKYRLKNVLILDWDVHHGNGTQENFYEDDSVFYISTHQYPHYPGTGAASETGKGKGNGYTLNLPFPAGTQPHLITGAVYDALEKVLPEFQPDILMISAGFDGHRDDPLGNWLLEESHFAEMTTMMMKHAGTYCGGKLISCLEGGYNLRSLASSCLAHCESLID